MVDADEGAVDPEFVGGDRQLDRLAERVPAGRRLRPLRPRPVAEAEEADALAMRRFVAHAEIVAGRGRRPGGVAGWGQALWTIRTLRWLWWATAPETLPSNTCLTP